MCGSPPTLLRALGRYGFPNERILPGSASDHVTEETHSAWGLVITTQRGLVYFGLASATVVRSPAPF
ncbi:hypothetical protein F3J24_04720 [Comamonas sp. Tr-654]|nr:hypothetical protein [Comamonas sp. Tr-654]